MSSGSSSTILGVSINSILGFGISLIGLGSGEGESEIDDSFPK